MIAKRIIVYGILLVWLGIAVFIYAFVFQAGGNRKTITVCSGELIITEERFRNVDAVGFPFILGVKGKGFKQGSYSRYINVKVVVCNPGDLECWPTMEGEYVYYGYQPLYREWYLFAYSPRSVIVRIQVIWLAVSLVAVSIFLLKYRRRRRAKALDARNDDGMADQHQHDDHTTTEGQETA